MANQGITLVWLLDFYFRKFTEIQHHKQIKKHIQVRQSEHRLFDPWPLQSMWHGVWLTSPEGCWTLPAISVRVGVNGWMTWSVNMLWLKEGSNTSSPFTWCKIKKHAANTYTQYHLVFISSIWHLFLFTLQFESSFFKCFHFGEYVHKYESKINSFQSQPKPPLVGMCLLPAVSQTNRHIYPLLYIWTSSRQPAFDRFLVMFYLFACSHLTKEPVVLYCVASIFNVLMR